MHARLEANVLRWPHDLGPPVDPMENVIRYRAQSALTGVEMQDGGPAPILPVDQSRDVLAWYRPCQ